MRLTLSSGIGNDTARKLLAAFESAQAIFEQSAATLAQVGSNKLVKAVQAEPPGLAALLQTTLQLLQAGDDRRIADRADG